MTNDTTRQRNLVIDDHTHVFWRGYDAARLVANMDENGIDVAWLLTWEAPEHEIALDWYQETFWPGRNCLPVEDVIRAVEQYPDRFVPFYAPDPREPQALKKLQGAVKYWGVRGCGEMECRIMMDDPHALEMWHYCGEAGLPVIFHMDIPLPRYQVDRDPGYWYCCDWDSLAKALELCPKTVFLGHAPGFWRGISGDADTDESAYPKGPVTPGGKLMAFMDDFPNLYCDLSAGSAATAISRDMKVGAKFIMDYQDRVLFGRDSYDDRLAKLLLQFELPEDVMTKIMGGNAMRLVPLG